MKTLLRVLPLPAWVLAGPANVPNIGKGVLLSSKTPFAHATPHTGICLLSADNTPFGPLSSWPLLYTNGNNRRPWITLDVTG